MVVVDAIAVGIHIIAVGALVITDTVAIGILVGQSAAMTAASMAPGSHSQSAGDDQTQHQSAGQ